MANIFLTGATGYAGQCVLPELLARGHLVGAAGIGLGILDHVANNYFAVHPGHLARVLRSLVFDGWLIFYLGMGGALAILLLDLHVTHSTLPVLPELERPPAMKGLGVWSFLTRKRALAYAVFRSRREIGLRRAEALCAAALLDAWFLNVRWLYDQPSNVTS
jgi:hypothetical protein